MGAVAADREKGIVSGYPDDSFRPDEPISRAEMAVMIARALGTAGNSGDPTAFADDADIPAWAKGAVEALRQLGIVQGREDNRFAPGDTATRAEAAVVLLRMTGKTIINTWAVQCGRPVFSASANVGPNPLRPPRHFL